MSKKNETDEVLAARLKKLKGTTPTLEELEDRLDRLKDIKPKSPVVKSTNNFEVDGIIEKAILDAKVDKTLTEIKNKKNQEAKKARAILDAKLEKTLGNKSLPVVPQANNKNRSPSLKSSAALNKSQSSQKNEKKHSTFLRQHLRVSQSLKNSQFFENLPKKQQLNAFERYFIEPIKKFISKIFNRGEVNHQKTEYSDTAKTLDKSHTKIEGLKEISKKGQEILSNTRAEVTALLENKEINKKALREKQLERKKKIINNYKGKSNSQNKGR